MAYPNRTICGMLDEMRKCYETYNFAPIAGLIEEVQSAANRMEAALEDRNDLNTYRRDLRKIRKEIEELREVKKGLSGKDEDEGPLHPFR